MDSHSTLFQMRALMASKLSELQDIPGSSDGKESTCNAGDLGLIPGSGRSPGEGDGNPLQYSCLENSMDRACDPVQFISLL